MWEVSSSAFMVQKGQTGEETNLALVKNDSSLHRGGQNGFQGAGRMAMLVLEQLLVQKNCGFSIKKQ